jgi:hypothetical protein
MIEDGKYFENPPLSGPVADEEGAKKRKGPKVQPKAKK